jgi:hypothetical protein
LKLTTLAYLWLGLMPVVLSSAFPAQSGQYNPDFIVDSLAVGASVYPDSSAYKAYKCRPSDQFPGFTWCGIKHSLTGKFGPYDAWDTILHSNANTAVFILKDIVPAYFASQDVEQEIQRLSQHFGQSAHVFASDPRPDSPHSIIATWGDVTLTPLDTSTMEALRRGETITAGLLIDFLADSQKSAREGLPVFHIGGGAGYIWAAKFDDAGKGRLRLTAVNSDLLPSPVEEPPPSVPSYAPISPPTPITVDPARIERDRAARADRAFAAAKRQLNDSAGFIKKYPHSPNLLDYIDRMAALSASQKAGDPDDIERKSADLADAFSHDKDYQQYEVDLKDARTKEEAQFLIDTIHRGQQERDFILGYVAQNPLADAASVLAVLVKQLNPALEHGHLAELQPIVERIDTTIREANLESTFIAAENVANNTTEDKTVETRPPTESAMLTSPLPTTDKKRFLVEGNLDDVEILYNASSKSPHVAQNLRGDFVFSQNQARVCLFGHGPDGLAPTAKQVILEKADRREITVGVQPCDPEMLLSYDVIVAQRGAFLRSKRNDALALIKTIEDDDYRQFGEITAEKMNRAAEAERTQIEKIKINIADGGPEGFGVVLLQTHSANLCVAVATNMPSHVELLLRSVQLDLEMQNEVQIKEMNVDDAFFQVQKQQCGAVYASAADLKTLTAALTRNDIPYMLSSLWKLPTDIEEENAALAEEARVVAQKEAERVLRNADQSRLASERAKDLGATRAARQDALRQKFGESARASANTLGSEIAALTKDRSGSIADFYPGYAAWLTNKLTDHWELITMDTEVQDFGTSKFKSRDLDTIFARVTLHLKNRMLGEYQDECFIFGRIVDKEFNMSREPTFARCNDEAAVTTWQAGHEFKSGWFAVSASN